MRRVLKWIGIYCICSIVFGAGALAILTVSRGDSTSSTQNNSPAGTVLGVQETVASSETVVSSSGPTNEERSYFSNVDKVTSNSDKAFANLAELFERGPDAIMYDNTTNALVLANLDVVRKEYQTAQKIVPPAGYEDINVELLSGLALWDASIVKTKLGIENGDADLLNEATIQILDGRKLVSSAKDKINIKVVE